ncbi:MAG: hypothetical protein RLZZ127_2367 [Planctomycetota bacterium]|jgi:1-phosphofructokinase family hexose kinase
MSTVVTVTANTLVDLLADGEVVPGAVSRVGRFTPIPGGKGLNVSRVLASHGHRVVACGFAGGDTGRMLADLVAADGVEPAFTQTGARTRLGVQIQGARSATTVVEDGFPVSANEVGQCLARIRALLDGADLVVCGGSVPDVAARDLYRHVADACAHRGVPCWIDAYGPAMEAALAGAHPPALAKPNQQEYAGLDAQRWLGCRELHVSDGPNPLRVLHPEGRFRVRPPAVAEVNPVGSGDCYLGALAHARLSGWPLPEQLRYAAAAGAVNAARPGIADLRPEDIAPHLARVQVEREP